MKSVRNFIYVISALLVVLAVFMFFAAYDSFAGYVLPLAFMVAMDGVGKLVISRVAEDNVNNIVFVIGGAASIVLAFWLLFGHFGKDSFYLTQVQVFALWALCTGAICFVVCYVLKDKKNGKQMNFFRLGVIGAVLVVGVVLGTLFSSHNVLKYLLVIVLIFQGISLAVFAASCQ